jgi:amino acid transporter
VESASAAAGTGGVEVLDKGLKKNAISFVSNIVIGVASTAPGYSLAATLGVVAAVAGIGLQSPAVMLVAFIPMFCIAMAYNYMNRADPDCGTTFTWVTRAIGPRAGWMGGWAIIVADIIVMANLAQIAGIYSFRLFDWSSAADSTFAVTLVGVLWIIVMTAICYIGIELSARSQKFLLGAEIITLVVFAVVALVKVYADHPAHSIEPAFSWFNPFEISSTSALTSGVLLAVFIYWGWDSGVTVNEETKDSSTAPGRAAVISTVILLAIYALVSAATQAYAGAEALVKNQKDVFGGGLASNVLGTPLDKLLIIAVLTSAAASTQTTILPTARTSLSMARQRAFPKVFGRVHPRYLSPSVSTLTMGGLSVAWYIAIVNLSTNVLVDSITALGFAIAFYYGLTGFACAFYFRRELFKSAKNFLLAGLLPVAGGVMLFAIFVKAFIDYKDPHCASCTSKPILGIGAPVAIGIGALLLGVVVMIIAHWPYREFFRRKPEVADPRVLAEPAPTPSAGGGS